MQPPTAGTRSVFPIPGLTRALIRSPYTILLPSLVRARRRFRMQNPRESKQSAGGDVCAVRFDNNPRALCCGVFHPTVFSPYSLSPSLLALFLPRTNTDYVKRCKPVLASPESETSLLINVIIKICFKLDNEILSFAISGSFRSSDFSENIPSLGD